MRKFFAKLAQAFEGPSDGIDQHPLSSKRIFAIACLVMAVYVSLHGGDATLVGVWLGASSAVLFGAAISGT